MRFSILILTLFLTLPGTQASAKFLGIDDLRFSLNYWSFSGEEHLGLTAQSTGYGGTLGKVWGKGRFKFMAEWGGCFIQGTESLLDGTTASDYDINGLITGLSLGPRLDIGKNFYVFALGTVEYLYVKLPIDLTYTLLEQTDNGTGTGYAVGAGFQFKLSNKEMFIDARYRDASATIFNVDAFTISGYIVNLGLQF